MSEESMNKELFFKRSLLGLSALFLCGVGVLECVPADAQDASAIKADKNRFFSLPPTPWADAKEALNSRKASSKPHYMGISSKEDLSEFWPTHYKSNKYSYYDRLKKFYPGTALGANEMRITFLGSMIPPARRAQSEMSIYVEVGWVVEKDGSAHPLDQFVFDCGAGVVGNYDAMLVPYNRMDKIFITHIHGDHIGDLGHIYGFGPSQGRFSPLYVWGPGPSNIQWTEPSEYNPSPKTLGKFDDGMNVYCQMLRASLRWHTESQSFLGSSYASYTPPSKDDWYLPCEPVPVKDPRAAYDDRYNQPDYVDSPTDAYALVPFELDWTKNGSGTDQNGNPDNIAYWNKTTGV